MTSPAMTAATRVYVGCSTGTPAPGIHVFDLEHTARGPALAARAQVDTVDHPSFLTAHPSAPVLYAVSETVDGEIVSFHVEPTDGTLTEWQRVASVGDGPCHLATDGAHLHVANYRSGSAAGYALLSDGRMSELAWSTRHQGRGPHARQDAPHAHCALPDPHRPSVHVVDLGTDRIVRYDLHPASGEFRPAAELVLAPGSGPRHLTFHPDRRTAFVVCELDNTIVAIDIHDPADELVPVATLSTVPDDAAGESLAAAVVIHPAGDRVYVSNRGHDSIATFAIGDDAAPLTLLGHVSSGGEGPRDLAIDPSGTLLLAANQRSGHIAGFALDDRTDLPRPLGTLARVEQPTCVLAIEVTP